MDATAVISLHHLIQLCRVGPDVIVLDMITGKCDRSIIQLMSVT